MTDETKSVMATNCLGCFVEEGARHKAACLWNESEAEVRTLRIDLLQLIESYGLRPRWASLDSLGTLTIAGSSKER